jgi:sugar lactone lactonase YvrE
LPSSAATGGQFLEGPLFDNEGALWLVEVLGGWLSRVEGDKVVRIVQATPDSQPQGTALHKDGRIFITDRCLGVWTYEPKSKKVDLLIRYYHGQPFKGPNDLTFDDDGNLYFTDAWQTGADDPSGALFMAEGCERLPQADKADRQSRDAQWRRGRSRWKFDLYLGAAQKTGTGVAPSTRITAVC